MVKRLLAHETPRKVLLLLYDFVTLFSIKKKGNEQVILLIVTKYLCYEARPHQKQHAMESIALLYIVICLEPSLI